VTLTRTARPTCALGGELDRWSSPLATDNVNIRLKRLIDTEAGEILSHLHGVQKKANKVLQVRLDEATGPNNLKSSTAPGRLKAPTLK
jgi:hypothetical protein